MREICAYGSMRGDCRKTVKLKTERACPTRGGPSCAILHIITSYCYILNLGSLISLSIKRRTGYAT